MVERVIVADSEGRAILNPVYLGRRTLSPETRVTLAEMDSGILAMEELDMRVGRDIEMHCNLAASCTNAYAPMCCQNIDHCDTEHNYKTARGGEQK